MTEYYLPDIPRLYTALAEWMACLIFILPFKKRFSPAVTGCLVAGAFGIQSVFLISTGGVRLIFWIPCMIFAVFLMVAFVFCCCEIRLTDAAYFGMIAFVAAELLSTRGSQTASVIFVVLNGQLAAGNITLTVRSLVVLQTSAITAALQFVVAIQLDIGIALAGHVYSCVGSIVKGGGTGIDSAAGVDVHILKLDLYLIILIFGLDGHSVGRRGVLVTICDGGVGVFLVGGRALCDLVRPFGLTRRNRNVTLLDVPCLGKSRGGQGGEHGGGQNKRRCPLRGRTG